MNRSFIVAVLTVTMIIMMSAAGHAITQPHNFYCDNCHGKTLGGDAKAASNRCIACHTTMGEASRMPIEAGDMSNYFGSAVDQPSSGSRSTHTWGATAPYNPRAFVQEPINTTLNSGYGGTTFVNGISCARCHNAKATFNNSPGVNKPFLRVTNVNDAMCLDCHRARQTTSHTTGSHPVNYRSYSAAYKSNTTAFRRTPLSANSRNKTAMLGSYLTTSGKIVCSTCHAPHYADSSSATLDNRSTANGFAQYSVSTGLKNQFQNSKGQLLRTDPLGASAASINVCSSCHKETKNINHNGKGQNVQCDHCHGAHVDYTGDTSLPNLYLVRRDFSNISISTGKLAAGKKAIYNTATSLSFKRADGNGICQVCHAPPAGGVHEQVVTRKADCMECHKHSNGFSAASCTSCHGQPPMTSYIGGPNGKASQSYGLDESLTPHSTHADPAYYHFACKNCHYDGTLAGSHNTLQSTGTATFQSVFINTTGSIGSHAGFKNVPANYDATSRTCSSVYCHSNGNPRNGTIAWKSSTPSWEYGKNKILGQATECTTCHDSGPTLNTNAHYKHVTTNKFGCNVCHAATVNSAGAISDRTKHSNGEKDISFITRPPNYQSVFSATFNPAVGAATCVNSCHTNGFGVSPTTPAKWTDASTGACGTCHASVPVTNLHSFHFYSSIGPKLGTSSTICSNCHSYSPGATTHANGVVDLKSPTAPCAPCHPGTTPSFTVGSKVTCESCHTGTASIVGAATAPLKDLNKTVGHGKYSSAQFSGKYVTCTTCHNASAPHIGAGTAEKRLLIAGNGLCNSCHTTAAGKIVNTARLDLPAHSGFSHYTTTADGRASDCAGCHDTHGTTNLFSIRTVINGKPVVHSAASPIFFESTPDANGRYNGLCQVCHTKTKYFRNDAPIPLPTSHSNSHNCLGCHKHNGLNVTFAFQPNGSCDTCHGYPPVRNMAGLGTLGNYTNAKFQDYSGGGGAHSVVGHIPKTINKSGLSANCTNCHNDFNNSHNQGSTPVKKSFVNVVVNPKFKFNNATSITYNANSCSNVSCHFKPSPNWTTGL